MLNEREVSAAIGTTAYGVDGEKLGTVEHFFTDDRTGAATWVALLTGWFGNRSSIVPAVDATLADGHLQLPVSATAMRSAPQPPGDHLGAEDEAALRRHYGLDVPDAGPPWAATAGGVAPAANVPVATGPSQQHDEQHAEQYAEQHEERHDGAMTRSEEQVRVGTEQVPARRVRLVKYVATEQVQVTVPLRHEEVRIEEVPLDGAAPEGGEVLVPDHAPADGLPEEIVLHAERPVVSVEVVPIERVRIRIDQVAGEERITEQVQRERIVVDQQDGTP